MTNQTVEKEVLLNKVEKSVIVLNPCMVVHKYKDLLLVPFSTKCSHPFMDEVQHKDGFTSWLLLLFLITCIANSCFYFISILNVALLFARLFSQKHCLFDQSAKNENNQTRTSFGVNKTHWHVVTAPSWHGWCASRSWWHQILMSHWDLHVSRCLCRKRTKWNPVFGIAK